MNAYKDIQCDECKAMLVRGQDHAATCSHWVDPCDDDGGAVEVADYRKARGVLKWEDGDELPEDAIRRLRGDDSKLRAERDDLRALLAEARPVVRGAVLAMCTPIATPDTAFYSCNFCGKAAADFLDIAHVRGCQTRSLRDLLALIDAKQGEQDG